jgi:hypothetical protein
MDPEGAKAEYEKVLLAAAEGLYWNATGAPPMPVTDEDEAQGRGEDDTMPPMPRPPLIGALFTVNVVYNSTPKHSKRTLSHMPNCTNKLSLPTEASTTTVVATVMAAAARQSLH